MQSDTLSRAPKVKFSIPADKWNIRYFKIHFSQYGDVEV